MAKRVTQADVAAAAGVSVTTVSFVLNDRANARISPRVASRVREVAERMRYSPDPAARSLRTGRTGMIGFVSDNVTITRYASAMIGGALDAAEARGHTVLMAEVGGQHGTLSSVIDSMVERRVDGFLFGMMSARRIEIPSDHVTGRGVLVNGLANGVPSLLPDEYEAGVAAVEYLVRAGHRKIALIGRSPRLLDPRTSVTIGERFRGIDAAMRRAGIEFVTEVEGHEWEPDLGGAGARRILAAGPECTAILAANDRIAFGVYQALSEQGLRVPQHISVMSFDDEELANYMRPGLTTMRLPYREMGQLGMQLLLDAISPQPVPAQRRSASDGDDMARTVPGIGIGTGTDSTRTSDDASALNGDVTPDADSAPRLVPMPLVERDSVARIAGTESR